MNFKRDPREIVVELLKRPVCSVKCSALLVDNWGVLAVGWNSSGPEGLGEHAEAHCLRRANRARLKNATMYVAASRTRNGRVLNAKPCPNCQKLIKGVGKVVYRDREGWKEL